MMSNDQPWQQPNSGQPDHPGPDYAPAGLGSPPQAGPDFAAPGSSVPDQTQTQYLGPGQTSYQGPGEQSVYPEPPAPVEPQSPPTRSSSRTQGVVVGAIAGAVVTALVIGAVLMFAGVLGGNNEARRPSQTMTPQAPPSDTDIPDRSGHPTTDPSRHVHPSTGTAPGTETTWPATRRPSSRSTVRTLPAGSRVQLSNGVAFTVPEGWRARFDDRRSATVLGPDGARFVASSVITRREIVASVDALHRRFRGSLTDVTMIDATESTIGADRGLDSAAGQIIGTVTSGNGDEIVVSTVGLLNPESNDGILASLLVPERADRQAAETAVNDMLAEIVDTLA